MSDQNSHQETQINSAQELLSSYEMAVLSTLFEQNDSYKLRDLAKQWGYRQELLRAAWKDIHSEMLGDEPERQVLR